MSDREMLIKWLMERRSNCLRLAKNKRGIDRIGWEEDADYFGKAIYYIEQGGFNAK